jgi:hypothetical protein
MKSRNRVRRKSSRRVRRVRRKSSRRKSMRRLRGGTYTTMIDDNILDNISRNLEDNNILNLGQVDREHNLAARNATTYFGNLSADVRNKNRIDGLLERHIKLCTSFRRTSQESPTSQTNKKLNKIILDMNDTITASRTYLNNIQDHSMYNLMAMLINMAISDENNCINGDY